MMNETLLFDSMSSPIPEIRRDLQIIPVNDEGRELIYFHDSMGYASPNFALDRGVEPFLSLINGQQSVNQILKLTNSDMDPFDLLEFVQLLDQHRILQTKHFRVFSNRIEKDFEKKEIRKPALAGDSYPNQPDNFRKVMDELLHENSGSEKNTVSQLKALYAPHIDLRIGSRQYAEAFSKIRSARPKRVVILATSHYSGIYGDFYRSTP